MRSDAALRALDGTGAGKIKHVVFIVQENRSFDNVFMNYPGADTVTSGKDFNGRHDPASPRAVSRLKYQIDHSSTAMFVACDGKRSCRASNAAWTASIKEVHFGGPKDDQYVYVPRKESKPYWDMAGEGVLGERRFNRSSTRATSRINTSSPRRRLRA